MRISDWSSDVCSSDLRLAQIDASFELHYCGRSRSRTAFLDRISSSRLSNKAHFHFDDGPEEQRLDVNAMLASPNPDTHLYACGPSGFLDFILGAANQFGWRSEEHTSELQSLMRISYAVFCLNKKTKTKDKLYE